MRGAHRRRGSHEGLNQARMARPATRPTERRYEENGMERESMEFDVLVARRRPCGPGRGDPFLKQLAEAKGSELSSVPDREGRGDRRPIRRGRSSIRARSTS